MTDLRVNENKIVRGLEINIKPKDLGGERTLLIITSKDTICDIVEAYYRVTCHDYKDQIFTGYMFDLFGAIAYIGFNEYAVAKHQYDNIERMLMMARLRNV